MAHRLLHVFLLRSKTSPKCVGSLAIECLLLYSSLFEFLVLIEIKNFINFYLHLHLFDPFLSLHFSSENDLHWDCFSANEEEKEFFHLFFTMRFQLLKRVSQEAFLIDDAFMYFAIVELPYGLTNFSLNMLNFDCPSIFGASSIFPSTKLFSRLYRSADF